MLGLADDGKVWSWTQETGVLIKSVHVDLVGNKVSRVAAGTYALRHIHPNSELY